MRERTGLRPRWHGHRRPPCLDLRRHVLGVRDPGHRQQAGNVLTREELEPLAEINVESLKDFDYFTVARINGKKVDFLDPPSGYYLDYKDQILTLHFTLPLKTPMKAQDVQIEISDPSYFVDFSFEKATRSRWSARRPDCKLEVARPEEMDPAMAAKLFQMAPDQKLDPAQYLGAQFASRILVKCS